MKILLTGLVLLCLATSATAQTDLTVDAVTRATTLNPYDGNVAALTDGITLEDDAAAGAVAWGGAGLFVAAWEEPVKIARVRIYLGLMERYAFYAYLGGSFSDAGTRIEVEEVAYTKEGLAPLDENIWWEFEAQPEIAVDGIGLSLGGTTVIYEIQFLGPDGTAIEPMSLGMLKKGLEAQ